MNALAIDDHLELNILLRSKISELTGLLRVMNVLTPFMHRVSDFTEPDKTIGKD